MPNMRRSFRYMLENPAAIRLIAELKSSVMEPYDWPPIETRMSRLKMTPVPQHGTEPAGSARSGVGGVGTDGPETYAFVRRCSGSIHKCTTQEWNRGPSWLATQA